MDQDRRDMLAILGSAIALVPLATSLPAAAQGKPAAIAPISLQRPRAKGGLSIMEALARRKSTREFSSRRLSQRHLGELLWAGIGINRPDGHRTSPNWRDMHSIDVFAVMSEGVYAYDPIAHKLVPHKAGNFLAMTGQQDFVGTAPLNLLMVANLSNMGSGTDDAKKISAAADSGCIAENIYLYCASEGIGTVFRGNIDRPPLHKALEFKPEQYIAYAQTVGYPK